MNSNMNFISHLIHFINFFPFFSFPFLINITLHKEIICIQSSLFNINISHHFQEQLSLPANMYTIAEKDTTCRRYTHIQGQEDQNYTNHTSIYILIHMSLHRFFF